MRKSRKRSVSKKAPISSSLRKAIRDRGLTAYATAKMAGVSVDAVQRFVNEERSLNLTTADKIAHSMKLSVCDELTE